jgi:hypothetical protein
MKYLFLLQHHAIMAYEGVEKQLHSLASAIAEGEWPASILGRTSAVLVQCNEYMFEYSYAPQNDVSVNDGLHIWRWSHNIILYYNRIL